jgi:penicillin amidase
MNRPALRISLASRASLGALTLACFAACDSSGTVVVAPPPPGPFGATPSITSTVNIANLSGPVDVLRDTNGLVHIWATNVNDALRVEGYQMARDRTAQLELARRLAEGRLAEIFGDLDPGRIDSDIAMRTVGMGREGQAIYDALGDGTPAHTELKAWLDAFSDGVSQFNARVVSGDEAIPSAMTGLDHGAFTPWTGADTLAIGRLESWELSYTADTEIAQTDFAQSARTTFATGKRAGFLVDVMRFAPLDPTLAMDGFPNDPNHTMALVRGPSATQVATPDVAPELLRGARGFLRAASSVRDVLGKLGIRGSNNWVVGPQRTQSGHVEVASDPHLGLGAPAIWWLVQLDVHDPNATDTSQDIHAEGVTFPGIPGIILGFNQHVAWGATVTDYDVTDVFDEQLTPDGGSVVFKGQNVPMQKVHEVINVHGMAPVEYDRLEVPHHGTIIPTVANHRVLPPDPTKGALSVEWTGEKPTFEVAALPGFLRSKSVEDFRVAIRNWATPSQNWVVGDDAGNIFYTTQSQVPLRDKRAYTWSPKTFSGTLPCFVEKGDGTAEWTGQFLDEAFVPHVKNPPKDYVGTANGDQVGDTLDNDPSSKLLPNGQPIYLGCWHDPGFRVGRIHQRIENLGHPMTLDDMAAIQADARSSLGSKLAPGLVTALEHAQAEAATPGTHADLTAIVSSARYKAAPIGELHDLLVKWGSASDYDTPPGVSLDDGTLVADATQAAASEATLVFQAWLMRVAQAILGDELTAMGWNPPGGVELADMRIVTTYLLTADPHMMATLDASTGDSALFDDMTTANVVESRDADSVTSLLDAIDYLGTKLGTDRTKWRWGSVHTLTFQALVPLWGALTIPPPTDSVFPNGFPRHGDGYNIDVGQPDSMPVQLKDAVFSYSAGPSQRFVIDLDPQKGPTARNVLPGGEVWDNTSPHFRDEAELWRRNQNHPIPFTHDDVAAAAEERISYKSAQ